MQAEAIAGLSAANRNPAVERAMILLGELARRPDGMSLDELVRQTAISRSSVYRILNSLEAHGAVRSGRGGVYVLGGLILKLASSTLTTKMDFDLPRIAQPHLEAAAFATGETAKVSIHDLGATLVVAGAPGVSGHALHSVVGRYLPLHAGAASKVLLAHLPQAEIRRLLHTRLPRFTRLTFCDEAPLLAELEQIRAQGWSYDGGEYGLDVHSYGAPITAEGGRVVGAVSIPFVARDDAAHYRRLFEQTLATALAIGDELRRS